MRQLSGAALNKVEAKKIYSDLSWEDVNSSDRSFNSGKNEGGASGARKHRSVMILDNDAPEVLQIEN